MPGTRPAQRTGAAHHGDFLAVRPISVRPPTNKVNPMALSRTSSESLDALKQRVLEALETVSYPARRDTLVASAREHGAAGDVIDALGALPDESYGSFSEVAALIAAHD